MRTNDLWLCYDGNTGAKDLAPVRHDAILPSLNGTHNLGAANWGRSVEGNDVYRFEGTPDAGETETARRWQGDGQSVAHSLHGPV